MNHATPNRPALRSLAEAFEVFQERVPAAEIARRLDLSTSTISRERKDKPILGWSFAEVIALARSDELLGNAVREFLSGGDIAGCDPQRLAADMDKEMEQTSELHRTVMRATADGKITPIERAQIRDAILVRQNTEAALLRDLEAMDQREGVRS